MRTRKKNKRGGGTKIIKDGPIPEYKIDNDSFFANVTVTLKEGEFFRVESGALNSSLENKGEPLVVTTKSGGILRGIGRKFAGEDFFHNFLTAPPGNEVEITFGANIPGNIRKIVLEPGEIYLINQGSFLACTPNINVTVKWGGLRGIFMNQTFITKIVNKGQKPGIAFLSAFGAAEEVDIPADKDLLIDNGLFLAAKYTGGDIFKISRPFKGIKSFVFGGEHFFMRFKGPQKITMQGGSFGNFATEISKVIYGKSGARRGGGRSRKKI